MKATALILDTLLSTKQKLGAIMTTSTHILGRRAVLNLLVNYRLAWT